MLGQCIAFADEMRLGLRGQVRRVWGIRGIKIRQQLECVYEWRYLALAVDGMRGRLWWKWIPNMRKETVRGVVEEWKACGIAGLVWDGAPGHKANMVRELGLPLVVQPAASPELNPAERVFEELRREVEGKVYGSIENKMAAVERQLTELGASPEKLRQLAGWSWIIEALGQLP
jgi:DDE superfamily endonuclease